MSPAIPTTNWSGDDRHGWVPALVIAVLLLIMIVPEGFHYGDLTSAGPASGDAVSRLLWLALLAIGAAVVLWRLPLVLLLLRSFNAYLFVFMLLAAMSVAWSIDPMTTMRRLVRVVTIVLDALAFTVISWHAQRFQSILRPLITAVLSASLLFGVLRPDLAIHPDTEGVLMNAWHGLASHKNGFGDLACVGLILWVHAWLVHETRSVAALAGTGLSVICLLLSRSSTSMVAAGLMLLFLTILLRSPIGLRRYMPYVVGIFVLLLLAYSIALLHLVPGLDILLAPVTMLTGKDSSFTGRSEIWEITMDHIRMNPFLGTGYGAYWTGPGEGTPAYEFTLRMHFYPGSAHNGYLEIVNDLGVVGLLALLGYLLRFVRQALELMQRHRGQAALYVALFLHQALSNMTESRWLNVLSIDFVIMTLVTASLARALLEDRLQDILGLPGARPTTDQAMVPA